MTAIWLNMLFERILNSIFEGTHGAVVFLGVGFVLMQIRTLT